MLRIARNDNLSKPPDVGQEASISARRTSASRRSPLEAPSTRGGRSGFGRSGRDADDVAGNLSCAAGGVLNVAGDLACRRALFFHRRRDRSGESLISPMVWPMFRMAPTADVVTVACGDLCANFVGSFAVWLRGFLPRRRPRKAAAASPARAASMVALSRAGWSAKRYLNQIDHDADAAGVVGETCMVASVRLLLRRPCGRSAPK